MKAVLIAALLCLAVIATEVATDKEVIITEFIENAKTSEFGQTILGTIELEIQNGSPGDVLVNMLDKIRQGQVSEIKSANDAHAKVQGQCKATLSQLKGEIKQHARNVIKSKEVVKKSSIQLAWSENQLEQQQRQQKELKLGLTKIQGIREKEADVFEKKINEINAALQVLHEGKSKIEKQFGSTQSFIEVKDTFQSYVQKMFLEIEKPEYHGRGYVSIISYLSELILAPAVVASKGGVQKILQLIQQIIDELQRAKTAETKAEDERLANFKELVDIYNKGIKDCDKAISNLNQAIGAAKEAITYNKRRIIDNTRAIRNKGRQQRKEKQKCRLEQRSYDKESKERNSELTVIEEALKLIKENIDEFRKIVLENSKAKIAAAYGGK